MTISSMTGFARTDGQFAASAGGISWTWEIKSVNGKNFELRCRLPAGFDALEIELRRRLSARISRGSVTISLQTRALGSAAGISVNEPALKVLMEVASRVAEDGIAPASLDGLMAIPGVVENLGALLDEDERQARDAALLKSFEAAVSALQKHRLEEGAALTPVITAQVNGIEALTAEAAASAALQPAALKERFFLRVADFVADVQGIAPERLAQEVALLASKADVREELDRLRGHVAAARLLLAEKEPVGRKLDFLAQEFNREANTLCSKSADLELTRIGLELKNVIGQFREQIQNIE
ncbi:YicC/YloC family endoribonuclease [Govanella unica]|uniref:YicC family protein n=1 Tax=Govanella unica TaxID=2975056 RepID=A0A9X3TYX9_9PROT|nr:YicC/YloC family endoribonuclease [Govania unica]MDA5194351.1 YicC family protein [Govania unica]